MKQFIVFLVLAFFSSCLQPSGGVVISSNGTTETESSGFILPLPGISLSTTIPYRGTSLSVTNACESASLDVILGNRLHLTGLKPGETWVAPTLKNWSGYSSNTVVVILGKSPTGELLGAMNTTVSVSGNYHDERSLIIRENDLR